MTEYVEILTESRSLSLNRTSAGQDIVIQFKLPVDDEGELLVPAYLKADFMGASDDVLALEIAYSLFPDGRWLPGSEGNDIFLVITDLKLDQVTNTGWWKARASYQYDDNTGTGGARSNDPNAITLPFVKIGFSVGNQTKRITQSIKVLSRDAQIGPQNRPNPCEERAGNAIGQAEDNVEGAEVYTNGLQLQITAYYFPKYVTWSFLNMMYAMVPSVNSDNFYTFAPGEVLLYGAEGQATVTDVIPITFSVQISPNIIDQDDPPFTKLTCPAHSFLDYRYVKELDECAQKMLQQPTHRIVHQVYKSFPFAQLGFPTQ
jgi:hypothetical protein